MNVLVVEPRMAPYEKEINGLLKEMQAIVGGRIATTDLPQEGAVIVSNDESICLGMEFNRKIDDKRGGVFGTFLSAGTAGMTFAPSLRIRWTISKRDSIKPRSCLLSTMAGRSLPRVTRSNRPARSRPGVRLRPGEPCLR